ncbi:MAG: YdhR family protein [Gemmatimonadetes bacterium]|nr:YdhR family protein [Gemmatimonadota bacterium]
MSSKILQISFHLNVPRAEFEDIARSLANDFAQLPGLTWKIWLMDETEREAGGIYLFEDASSMEAYLEGPLAAAVMSHPALSDLVAKQFDVIEDCTAITRGPVEIAETA